MTKRLAAKGTVITVNLAEAVRLREIALAGLKRHELAAMAMQWIPRDVLAAAWGGVSARIRDRLLEVPAAAAARLASCNQVGEAQAALMDVIYGALTELSAHDPTTAIATTPTADLRLDGGASKLLAETSKILAQGSLRQIEVEIAAGNLISVEDSEAALSGVLEVVRQRMLHVAGSMSSRLLGRGADQVETVLRRAVLEALDELEDALPLSAASTSRRRQHAN